MKQLVMYWKNDGPETPMPTLPTGVTVATLPQLKDGVQAWLDIVGYMAQDGKQVLDEAYYEKTMTSRPNYDEKLCYFLLVDGAPAATLTVICDYATKAGYIHMVAAKPDYRGRGLGHMLNLLAVATLKREGMETAHLTTDDWRLAAIKTYLKAGFTPDTDSEPDYAERWQAVLQQLGLQ